MLYYGNEMEVNSICLYLLIPEINIQTFVNVLIETREKD